MAAHFFWYAGQSNCNGFESGPPADIPAVPFYRRGMPSGNYAYSDTSPTTLQVTTGGVEFHGMELQFGKELIGGGLTTSECFILKTGYGGTLITEWLQGAGGINQYERVLRAFRGARFARSQITWHFIWNQGEQEALNANGALAAAWADNYTLLVSQTEAVIGASFASKTIVRTHDPLTGQANLAALRTSQAAAATAHGANLIDIDDLTNLVDGVHLDAASQNTLGTRVYQAIF